MNEIKCPRDLNQFLLGEPIFENTFSEEECEQRKFYGDCYHCFATAIGKRDYQIEKINMSELDDTIENDLSDARCIDRWNIGDKEAEAWIVKGKLQIRHGGVIHNIDLAGIPSVTPKEPKIGHWIRYKENCCYNKCSICEYAYCRESNYCPNCGAKMKKWEVR